MSEESRTLFWTGIRNGLCESFRISEADKSARMGAFRRVVAVLTQIAGALGVALVFVYSVGSWAQTEGLLQKAAGIGFLLTLLGFSLSVLFVRVELNDKGGVISTTHPLGRWGGWLIVAGIVIFFGSHAIRFLLAFGGV